MIADYRVLLDSCVLANYAVCDLYLRMAETPRLLIPKWTEEILDEVYRTHTEKLQWPDELATSFREEIVKAFPEAMITGYEGLIPVMKNDEKDRHVLAAAVREKLDLIITFNLKDFKTEALEPWNLKAVHPQDYLLSIFSMDPAKFIAKLSGISRKREEELEDTILYLGRALPALSTRLINDLSE